MNCPKCGSDKTVSRGASIQCKNCKQYSKIIQKIHRFRSDGNTAEVSTLTEKRVKTLADLIEVCEIDTETWRVDRWEQGKSEGYRKDRQVEWDVKNGNVSYGHVRDTGKLLIKPLWSVKAWLVRKKEEIRDKEAIKRFIKDAQKFSPKYKSIHYKTNKDGYLYEIGMPDLQLGRLVMAEEAGKDSSPDLYVSRVDKAINGLLAHTEHYKINKVLFPIGNDFFDSNNSAMTTAHGTPQQDDVRWQRTFKLGREMMVKAIDKMQQIAPVDVLIIKGNHDEERLFYLGDSLSSWYHNCKNVTVDNRPMGRKYYSYGKSLIMFAHGYFEKVEDLGALMAYERPKEWARSIYREVHLGDKHHKKDFILKSNETKSGVVVRILRSLAPPSVWEYDKTFVASLKAAEAFLWHPNRGVVGQFTESPDEL